MIRTFSTIEKPAALIGYNDSLLIEFMSHNGPAEITIHMHTIGGIYALASNGRKVTAIAMLRELIPGMGLKAAKDVVEHILECYDPQLTTKHMPDSKQHEVSLGDILEAAISGRGL